MKRLSLSIAFLFLGVYANALTLSDIETQVRRHIRDTSTTSTLQQYSDTVLDAVINEVQKDVVNQTWCVENSTSITLASGTTYYSLPNDLIVPFRVTFTNASNDVIELEETTQAQLTVNNPDYETNSSGSPTEYFIRHSTYGANALQIGVYPVPTSSSTGTVKMDYAAQATDLSTDADVPFEGLRHLYPYHEVLVWGTVARIKWMQYRNDEAANYLTLYINALTLMKNKLNELPNYRPNFTGGRK